MSYQPLPGAVIFAKDVARLAAFYEQIFSLAVKYATPDKVILETSSLLLVIHAIPADVASSINITEPPLMRENCALKLILPVQSLAETRAKAHALGGGLAPEAMEWSAGNFNACDGFDPEGNVLQFREIAV